MSQCLTLDYGIITEYYGGVWEPLCCYTVPSQTYDDFVTLGGENPAKDAGKMRAEGKSYTVQDGDVMHFLFNT